MLLVISCHCCCMHFAAKHIEFPSQEMIYLKLNLSSDVSFKMHLLQLHSMCVFPQPHKGSQKKAKIPPVAGKTLVIMSNKYFVEIQNYPVVKCDYTAYVTLYFCVSPSSRSIVSSGVTRCWRWMWLVGSRRWWIALSRLAAASVTAISTSSTRSSVGSLA